MTITIHSTTKVVELTGNTGTVPARIWEGQTASGIPVMCYVTRIATQAGEDDLAEFERDLQRQAPPSAAAEAIPLRLIL